MSKPRPLLSITIPSVWDQVYRTNTLVKELTSQIGTNKDIEIVSVIDNRICTIGKKREKCIAVADGEYQVQIDSDDFVVNDYITSIYQSIKANPGIDVITFDQAVTMSGTKGIVSWRLFYPFKKNYQIDTPYIPNTTCIRSDMHLCCIKTEIAKQVKFIDDNWAEDWTWSKEILPLLKTEYHIDKVLYLYSNAGTFYKPVGA
jgi:hypothetical protein